MGVLYAHVNDSPPRLGDRRADVPGAIDAVLARGMAKNPEQRYATCAELVDEARRELALTGDVPAASPALTRRRLLLGTAGAVVLAAGAAGAAVLVTRSGDAPVAPPLDIRPGSLARVAPESNELVAVVNLASSSDLDTVAVGAGAVWVASFGNETVSRIDPAGAVVTRTVSVEGSPRDIAVGEGAVWVVSFFEQDGKLSEIDPATSRLRPVHDLSIGEPRGVTTGFGAVWVTGMNAKGDRAVVLRVAPATGEVMASIALPEPPGAQGVPAGVVAEPPGRVAAGEGAVWVGSGVGEDLIWKIDPDTNEVVATIDVLQQWDFVAAGGALWVAQGFRSSVARIDATTDRVTTVPVDGPVGSRGVRRRFRLGPRARQAAPHRSRVQPGARPDRPDRRTRGRAHQPRPGRGRRRPGGHLGRGARVDGRQPL